MFGCLCFDIGKREMISVPPSAEEGTGTLKNKNNTSATERVGYFQWERKRIVR